MKQLQINPTNITPEVIFNKEENIFSIAGKSLPEDAKGFYNPVLAWMDEYLADPNEKTKFVFKLEYFNTSSSKMILIILKKLTELRKMNKEILINWYYPQDDEEILEAGEEYSDIIPIEFIFIDY